jgi:RecA/RadA recombinase
MAAKKKAEEEKSVKNQKDGAPLSRAERAAALMDEVNKKMKGRAILKAASDYVLPWSVKRVPTGLLTLDIELRGGFPCGGISQIVGRRNAGKTLLAWQCVRQLQHFIGNKLMVLLAMTEIPADRSQARKVGVQIHLGDDELYALNEGRMLRGEKPLTRKEADELFPQ